MGDFKFIIAIIICGFLFGCGDAQADDAKIPGFSPVEERIVDWDQRRKMPFKLTFDRSDGEPFTVLHSERFRCEDAEDRVFELKQNDKGQITPIVFEDQVLEIPNDLQSILSELAEKVRDGKLKSKGEMFAYHIRRAPVDFIAFNDGWLVAFSRGEWSGVLLWIESNGAVRVLDENNANDLLMHDGEIYSASGVDHMFTDNEYILALKKDGKKFRIRKIPSMSAVNKLAAQDGKLVGLTGGGVIYIDDKDVVHFKRRSSGNFIGFRPLNVGFLSNGDVYIAGQNMVGIYTSLPDLSVPDLYIPNDCKIIFERKVTD